jgi:hypothetical protein
MKFIVVHMKAAMRYQSATYSGGSRRCYYDKERNFGKQRELASFEPVIVAERQRDEPSYEGEAPHPCQRYAPLSPDHPNAA